MINRSIVAVLSVFGITLSHAQDAAKTNPETGKNCVTLLSSEITAAGLVRVYFRNTCGSPFQIQIEANQRTREAAITAGTTKAPSKAYVTCRAQDGCEGAKWKYN